MLSLAQSQKSISEPLNLLILLVPRQSLGTSRILIPVAPEYRGDGSAVSLQLITVGTRHCRLLISTRSQALPGNADPEAPPPILLHKRGRASRHRFPGRAGEPVKPVKL
jgi:hypothetical protein